MKQIFVVGVGYVGLVIPASLAKIVLERVRDAMKTPMIFDWRKICDREEMHAPGFSYC